MKPTEIRVTIEVLGGEDGNVMDSEVVLIDWKDRDASGPGDIDTAVELLVERVRDDLTGDEDDEEDA